jgi:hypothetical protein
MLHIKWAFSRFDWQVNLTHYLPPAVAEIHFFRWGGGGKPPKFPTTPPPPFALEKAVFSSLLGQDFQKFVIFREGGGGGGGQSSPPRRTKISATDRLGSK